MRIFSFLVVVFLVAAATAQEAPKWALNSIVPAEDRGRIEIFGEVLLDSEEGFLAVTCHCGEQFFAWAEQNAPVLLVSNGRGLFSREIYFITLYVVSPTARYSWSQHRLIWNQPLTISQAGRWEIDLLAENKEVGFMSSVPLDVTPTIIGTYFRAVVMVARPTSLLMEDGRAPPQRTVDPSLPFVITFEGREFLYYAPDSPSQVL